MRNPRVSTYHCARRLGSGEAIAVCSSPENMEMSILSGRGGEAVACEVEYRAEAVVIEREVGGALPCDFGRPRGSRRGSVRVAGRGPRLPGARRPALRGWAHSWRRAAMGSVEAARRAAR